MKQPEVIKNIRFADRVVYPSIGRKCIEEILFGLLVPAEPRVTIRYEKLSVSHFPVFITCPENPVCVAALFESLFDPAAVIIDYPTAAENDTPADMVVLSTIRGGALKEGHSFAKKTLLTITITYL